MYTKTCPRTCANFKALCTGEKGVSEATGVRLSYINTLIHRIVPGGWVQAGDIVDGSGSGGESIYGVTFDGLSSTGNIMSCLCVAQFVLELSKM